MCAILSKTDPSSRQCTMVLVGSQDFMHILVQHRVPKSKLSPYSVPGPYEYIYQTQWLQT